MNAKQLLIQFVQKGTGVHLQFAGMVAELLNDDAVVNSGQRAFLMGIVQAGPGDDATTRMLEIATFVNTCH